MYCAQMAGVEDPVNEIRLKVAHVMRENRKVVKKKPLPNSL
jgi:hypothetical protein